MRRETCILQKVLAEGWMHVPFEWKTLLSPFLHCHFKTKMLGVMLFSSLYCSAAITSCQNSLLTRLPSESTILLISKDQGQSLGGGPGGFRIQKYRTNKPWIS